ncbi:MAG: hypothetical protein Q9170_005004 [Blastenia crenularia]
MYIILIWYFNVFYLCSARPAQNEPNPVLTQPGRPFMGFPAQYLPYTSSDTAVNRTDSLAKPLYPAAHPDLECSIEYHPGISPYGPALMANIAAYVYPIWRDTANLRIRNRIEKRVGPFTNFKWTTEPMLQSGAALTPLKLGIVLLWILDGVSKEGNWPGQIDATLWDSTSQDRLEVGSLGLLNAPVTGSDSSSSANNTLNAVPQFLEKRWLRCWSRMFPVMMGHYFADFVSDSIEIRSGPGQLTSLRIRCGPDLPSSNDFFVVIFYWRARAEFPQPLTYDRMADAMVKWATQIARGAYPWNIRWGIWNHAAGQREKETIAIMAVELDGYRSSDSPDSPAATA